MTNSELSNEFDVLYNNITSNQAPGLNEYEKSVFLTKAQSQLVNEYFNNRTDGFGGGFDGSQKRQYDFSSLTRVANLFEINTFKERISNLEKLDKRSKVYLFPHNYYLAVNEILSDDSKQYSVIPLTHTEYQRLMLKPYSMPVKKAAWRMFTDKKNCNYCRELANSEADHSAEYVIMSSWADQKRNLKVTIKAEPADVVLNDSFELKEDSILFSAKIENTYIPIKITCDSGWKDSSTTYSIDITVNYVGSDYEFDDEEILEVIKRAFKLAKDKDLSKHDEILKTMTHMDGFSMCSAPSKFYNFSKESTDEKGTTKKGKEFTTKVIQLPIAEIIGKFNNIPTYKLRYIKTLNPIILDDLSNYGEDISIDGIDTKSECELPEETHQEILERAVTLAKIAWQGGTITQAQTKE
jgi:hypothetical protein